MLPLVALHIYLFRLLLERKNWKGNKCMSKSLLRIFSAWAIIHDKKYSYNLKLAQMSQANFTNFWSFNTAECKILRSIVVANLAFFMINTILPFTFSSK